MSTQRWCGGGVADAGGGVGGAATGGGLGVVVSAPPAAPGSAGLVRGGEVAVPVAEPRDGVAAPGEWEVSAREPTLRTGAWPGRTACADGASGAVRCCGSRTVWVVGACVP